MAGPQGVTGLSADVSTQVKAGAWGRFVDWLIGLFPDWTTPNQLSFLRLGLAAAMAALEFAGGGLGLIILLGLAAGFSDLFDGALARRRGLESDLGAFLDPLGDKVFALVLAVIVWRRDLLPHPLILAVLITEVHTVLVPLLVLLQRLRNRKPLWPPTKVKPNRFGKLKTGGLAMGMGFTVIAAWLEAPWLATFSLWGFWAGLALGLAAEIKYLTDWARGAYV